MQLKVENRFIDYFDEATEIYRGMELVDSELGGTIPLELVVYPAAEQAIDDDASFDEFDDEFGDEFGESSSEISPWFTIAGLNELDRIHQDMDGLTETGKVLSLATVYQLAQDLLGGGLDDIQLALAYRNLPAEIKEVMITPYLYDEINEARITVRVKETSRTLNRAELLADLDRFMQEDMGYSEGRYRFTGMLVLYNNLLQSLFVSQILTLGLVFVAITAMLVVLFQSFNLALIGIVPNLMAALLVLGGMGWAGVPLDMMTITIAAISIGIGVDNTIHYVHRFKREFQHDGDYIATMYRCHASIGRAMYYTSITIIFGFSILALSNFKPSIYFGLLTGVAMLSALLGSLLLLPKLLLLFKPLGTMQARE
jgi:predicted RND superfamily exporter protein